MDEALVIRIKGLCNRIGTHVIHEDLDLDVRRGEVLGLVGATGTGKSILLHTILGLRRPVEGTVEVLGHELKQLDDASRRRLEVRCGVLFQHGALFSSLTVAQNIQVPFKEHTDLPPALMDELTANKIAMAGLPPDAGAKYPSELSGGMRKRAALARALALDPEILFLDEPTAGLDPIGADAFDSLIRNIRQSLELTVFMVTHDLDSLGTICDRIGALVDKRVMVGTMEWLRRQAHPWVRAYFHGPRARAARRA